MTHFVRPAVAGDTGRIAAIYAEAVTTGTASYELEAPTRDEMVARFAVLRDASYPYLVAQSGDEIVGYAYAGPFRTRPAYRFIVEDSIYVAPSAKGRGIGSLLLQRLIDESRTLGFRQMIAVIGDSAQAPSIELHRALGFRMIGAVENVGYKFGRWLDSVNMQRALGAGATTKPD
jgi:L-amino acid N-acyltransferase YncA